jgi:hypothetical protein
MKALKVVALLLVLVGVVANVSAHTVLDGNGVICAESTDPTLCDQTTGEDLMCSPFCDADPTCTNSNINYVAECRPRSGGGYKCVCHGPV